MNRKRRTKERAAGAVPQREAVKEVWEQVQALLDAELSLLPDRYRVPIVLCELEGQTIKEAARQLGWPQGTLATRLARGRALLARRLARHGLTLSGGLLATVLSHGMTTASVPAALLLATVRTASLLAAEPVATAGVISTKVAALTDGVVKAMLMTKLKALTASLLAALALGGGLLTCALRAEQTEAPQESPSPALAQPDQARADQEPLPTLPPVAERNRHDMWRAASAALHREPSLRIHYTFEPDEESDVILRNQAGGPNPAHDGAIVGCSWVEGRWPGKRALAFGRAGDRVRVHLGDTLESITLVAWIRVDALPNTNNALFLTDGWKPGALHWQIGEKGKLVLGVKAAPPAPPVKGVVLQTIWDELVLGGKKPVTPDGHYHALDVFDPESSPERLGRWGQLAVVHDRAQRQITHYVDGRPAARVPIVADIPLRIDDAEIGNWRAPNFKGDTMRNFKGRMDEFLLFSRALTDREIEQLYTDGRPSVPSHPGKKQDGPASLTSGERPLLPERAKR